MDRGRGERGRGRKRSIVWDYFTRYMGDDGKERSSCKRCRKEYKISGTSTSNMLAHISQCTGDQGHGQQLPPNPPLPVAPQDGDPLQGHVVQGQQLPPNAPLPVAPQDEDSQPQGHVVQGQQQLPPNAPLRVTTQDGDSQGQGQQLPPNPPLPVAPQDGELPAHLPVASQNQQQQQPPLLQLLLDDDEKEATRDLARMVALHGACIVEDPNFISLLRRLDPKFILPAREDIEKACETVIKQDRDMTILKPGCFPFPGAQSFVVGKARFGEAAGEVIYMVCSFIDEDWNLHRHVVAAYLVFSPGDHLRPAATSFLGIPVVSAEVATQHAVDFSVDAYEHYPLMVAGEMSGSIGYMELKHLSDQVDRNGIEVLFTAAVDHVFHSVARSLVPRADLTEAILSTDVAEAKWERSKRCELLSEMGLDDPLESSESWYWCYCALMISNHVQPLPLDSQRMLSSIWGQIYSSMKKVCAPTTVTAHLALDELLKVRAAVQSNMSASGAADLPLTETLQVIDKAIDDSYLVWSLPLVMDPRYKLRHIQEQFEKAFNDAKATSYTLQIRNKVKDLYAGFYSETAYDSDDGDDDSDEEELMGSWDEDMTEVEDYLQDSLAKTAEGLDFDILTWWADYGTVQYPMVTRLARAALAMPTCSELTIAQSADVKSLIRGYDII